MASSLSVEELRSRLHDLGLETKGKKADLRLRLKKALRTQSATPDGISASASAPADSKWDPEFDTFLVLDVEATCESTRKYRNLQHGFETGSFQYPNEIIEFPIVILKWNQDSEQLETKAIFHSYVQPTFRPKLTKFCKDLTGVTQGQVDSAPLWNQVVEQFFRFLVSHDLVEDTSGGGRGSLQNYRLKRGVAWINHGPADLRDFVVKQSFISAIPRDKSHGLPPVFLRGPLVDIRKGIAALFKWEQDLKASLVRSSPSSRASPFPGFGGRDGFQVVSPPALNNSEVVKEAARSTGLSPYDQSLAGLLELLNIGPFQGRQHCGMDDTLNVSRLAVELARRIAIAARTGDQVLLSKHYEAVDGTVEASAKMLSLGKDGCLKRARKMEKLVLSPNVRVDTGGSTGKRFFWMGKLAGQVKWPFPPEVDESESMV
ncbi:uncharacterized protein MEPE_02770 [Melanopsichium pennsylvanicum]|uniref:SAP domain-containing protein n=2 Tax=Melanopsichium pennsylvanicum TaxID=63383 RepID=A0AAJ5C4V1_9BASI|nr:double-strand sirna ribonuclease [Melanopsichium pennsylvanicum 4]SNX84062.1 uncharacterized protein MEPE_02770 [Melanopsichium pennsylvanicum]